MTMGVFPARKSGLSEPLPAGDAGGFSGVLPCLSGERPHNQAGVAPLLHIHTRIGAQNIDALLDSVVKRFESGNAVHLDIFGGRDDPVGFRVQLEDALNRGEARYSDYLRPGFEFLQTLMDPSAV
mgnify:CR=1 FL=1